MKGIIRHPFETNFYKLKKAASLAYYLPATMIAKQKLELLETATY